MTNQMSVIVLGVLALTVCLAMLMAGVQKNMRNVIGAFTGYGLSVLGWLLSDVVYFLANDPWAVLYLYNVKFIFVAGVSVAELILVMRFYRLDRYVTKRLKLSLFIPMALMALLVFTSPWHTILRREQLVVAMEPIHLIAGTRGAGFWLHAAFCYALTAISAVVVFVQHPKQPAGHRAPSFVMAVAMLIVIVSSGFRIFYSLPFDITSIGAGISVLFIYASISASHKSDLLEVAKEEIYNSMEECLFVSDLNKQVIDANNAGRRWLEYLGIRPEFPFHFDRIFFVLRRRGATIHDHGEAQAGTDIYYSSEDAGVVYNLRERFVYDKLDRPVGVYSTLLDITRYRRIIDRLEKAVEIDSLTGLANRRVFEALKQRFTEEGTQPLGVILGDANGLKQVNDTLGHHQGDQFLRVLAQVLRQCCPEGGTVARIGGDEFAMLLPNCSEEMLPRVMHNIRRALASRASQYDFMPSISLGAAVRQQEGPGSLLEDMEHLVRRADENMYSDKQNDRRN